MVLLTMTPSIVEALSRADPKFDTDAPATTNSTSSGPQSAEPLLNEPKLGNAIAHSQILRLWRTLRKQGESTTTLEDLLCGAHIYTPPPPPKPEPSPEFKALMARLRREEEARAYERMVNPPAKLQSFQQLFPNSAQAFAEVNRPTSAADIGDDEVSFNEIHRQVTLIINFLVSIAGVAGTLWVAARWWSLPSRIFLALGGAILVAIAEVVVYNVYIWRMGEAKKKQTGVKELKEVVETWVVGDDDGAAEGEKTVLLQETKDTATTDGVRKRKTEQKADE